MTRRQIAPYSTRIALDYESIYGLPDVGGPYFVCMGEGDIEVIRLLLGYAKRRIQWYADWTESPAYYLGLDDSEWENVIDSIDDLEGRLMGVICVQDIVDAIGDLTTQVGVNGAALQAMMECVCDSEHWQELMAGRLPDLTGYVDEGLVTYDLEENVRGNPTDPATDQARCELAQAMWYYTFQMFTEILLPYANNTADVLTDLLIASSAIPLLAGWAGVPVSVVGLAVAAVIAWGVDGAIADFTNWMLGSKDELICLYYDNYPAYDNAAAAVKAWSATQPELSFLERQVFNAVGASAWHMTWVSQDQQTNGTWNTYFVPGQCDVCGPLPPTFTFDATPCPNTDFDDFGGQFCQEDKITAGGGFTPLTNEFATAAGSDIRVVVNAKGFMPQFDPSTIRVTLYNRETADSSRYFIGSWPLSVTQDQEDTFLACPASNLWSIRFQHDPPNSFNQIGLIRVDVYVTTP